MSSYFLPNIYCTGVYSGAILFKLFICWLASLMLLTMDYYAASCSMNSVIDLAVQESVDKP